MILLFFDEQKRLFCVFFFSRMNTNNTFQKAAKRVGYLSSVVLLGTIGSLVMYASFAAFTGPVSGPSAANHSKGFLYDYMFGAATTSGAVQQGTNWTDVPSSGTAALAGTLNEKLNFVVNKLFTGISTAALDGVYDSTAVAANKNGNALNILKYIQQGIDSAGAAGGGVTNTWQSLLLATTTGGARKS